MLKLDQYNFSQRFSLFRGLPWILCAFGQTLSGPQAPLSHLRCDHVGKAPCWPSACHSLSPSQSLQAKGPPWLYTESQSLPASSRLGTFLCGNEPFTSAPLPCGWGEKGSPHISVSFLDPRRVKLIFCFTVFGLSWGSWNMPLSYTGKQLSAPPP